MIANKLQTIHTEVGNIKSAIVEKGGNPTTLDTFADEIRGIESGGGKQYTGHADVEGLRAIGWDDDDIATFQENGVDWDEEDDDLFKVPDYDKEVALVINSSNYRNYTQLTYLPKFTFPSNVTKNFRDFTSLIALPILSGVKFYSSQFRNCYCLKHIPFEIEGLPASLSQYFLSCFSLRRAPRIDYSQVKTYSQVFNGTCLIEEIDLTGMRDDVTQFDRAISTCYNLKRIKGLVMTRNIIDATYLCYNCYNLVSIDGTIDVSSCTTLTNFFNLCYNLRDVTIVGLPALNISFVYCYSLSHASLLSILNALPQTSSTLTLTLGATNINKLTADEIAIGTQKGWTIN